MSFPLDRLAIQLDWNLLRTFMVIVQERSITGAAGRLNVSQPSVSSALRRLEERLDLRLVERGAGMPFTITRAGEAVYREALEMYGGVIRLNEAGSFGRKNLTGTVIVYHSSHLDMNFLIPILDEFRELHPNVTVALHSTSCMEVCQALLQKVSTVGFCTRVDPTRRLTSKPLVSQEFAVYCGEAHLLYRKQEVAAEVLAKSSVAGFEAEHMAGPLSNLTIHRVRHGIGDKTIATATGIVDLVELITYANVIGFMSRGHANRYGHKLWQIPVDAPAALVDVFSVVDAGRMMTPIELTFIEHLENHGLVNALRQISSIELGINN